MIKFSGKKFLPHIIAVLIFLILSVIYFSPVLDGKQLSQHDTNTSIGASKEITDYNKTHNDVALWTNSMFGGMPSYLIALPMKSALTIVYAITTLDNWRPVSFTFLYFLGFYMALLLFGVNPWLAIVGALGFGFSSYNFIIIAAGHNTKAIAIGYLAPIIAGLYYAMKKKIWVGGAVFSLFLALQIYANHLQISYYSFLTVIVFMVTELFFAIKYRQTPNYLKRTAIIIGFALLAAASNIGRIWTTYEYGEYSMRGGSELTSEKENRTSGLDKDYATAWSYGIGETFTLFIPDFRGGSSTSGLTTNSESYKVLNQNGIQNANNIVSQLAYWGDQPFTSGPVYAGAIMFFLFILGLFIVRGSVKIWIIIATVLAVVLSWGHNFMPLTNLFLDYFPGYNKFRTVSMTLVIASFTIPLLGILALQRILEGGIDKKEWKNALLWSLGLTAGLSLIFAAIPGLAGSFFSNNDAQLPDWLKTALVTDRTELLRTDAFRSVIFILLAVAVLLIYMSKKLKFNTLLILLGGLIVIDQWSVDKRYLNNDNFVPEREAKIPYKASTADEAILKDKAPDYRVLNITVSTFNDASTSYFHESVGGYHGAKMRRYQELIDTQLGKDIQLVSQRLQKVKTAGGLDSVFIGLNALNMLNTKYVVYNPNTLPAPNRHAFGNAWIVDKYKLVDNADQELAALGEIDPAKEIVVNKRFESELTGTTAKDTTAKITLTNYSPNKLEYNYKGSGINLAVFSEIYYPKGWNAYIDSKKAPYFQADYVLRCMKIPSGNHKIEFRFEPKSYFIGSRISQWSALILLLLLLGIFVKEVCDVNGK